MRNHLHFILICESNKTDIDEIRDDAIFLLAFEETRLRHYRDQLVEQFDYRLSGKSTPFQLFGYSNLTQ